MKARVLYAYIDPESVARWSDECVVDIEDVHEMPQKRSPQRETTLSLNIVPNPANSEFWYETNAPISSTWVLLNTLGKIVQSGQTESTTRTRLEITTVPPGTYTFSVRGNGTISKKIIKI